MKNKLSLIISPILFAIILVLGMYIGKKIASKQEISILESFIKMDKLHTVLNYVEREYVDTIDRADIVEKAIPLVLEQLDPHSMYIPAKDMKALNEPINGNFEGIGVMFRMQNDTVVVINTIHGGPSDKIGILPGDRIVYVDDTLFAGVKMNTDKVMKHLKGKRGTKVKVKVKRRSYSDLLDFTIVRDKIPLKSVDVAYKISNNTAYVKISQFTLKTYSEFIQQIYKFKEQGVNSWMIDLRGNGGGIMQAAVQIADEFLPKGQLVVYTQGKARPREEIVATSKGACENDKVVILIDEWSASASEILAGALQDNDRCEIIGRRSFGKGLVQEPIYFKDGSGLRLTIARYYTPTGRCIQKAYDKGLEEYYSDISKRYLHGEFSQKDSIHFSDSLKFVTPKGKVVYGGGGIMPDYFVPVDTLGYSNYFKKLVAKGLINRFAFDYTDTHRAVLSQFKDYKSLNTYLEKKRIVQQFIDFAKKEGIAYHQADFETSKQRIRNFLLGYINRNLLDDEGFYPTINKDDKTILKAQEVLEGMQ